MSRNFELLQQAGWDEGIFRKTSPVPEPATEPSPAPVPTPSVLPGKRSLVDTDLCLFVHSIFLESARTSPKAAVFSGLKRHVGCSSVCAAVTRVLAQETQQRVCAVDGNSLAPSLHLYFGASNHTGLTDFLQLTQPLDAFAQRFAGSNHWFLAHGQSGAGRRPVAGSLGSGRWIRELRNSFDFVLIDAPPLTVGKAAVNLAATSDGVILVADSSEAFASDLWNTKRRLQSARVPLLGVVMTQESDRAPNLLTRLFQ